MPLLLLDLDGTVREPLDGHKFIQRPRHQRIIAKAEQAYPAIMSGMARNTRLLVSRTWSGSWIDYLL